MAAPTDFRTVGVIGRLRRMGPGLLVAAAFVGPGTVTTASVAGADFGFALVWALVFAVAAAMILQEMSARLGLVSREGLGEALRTTFANRAVSVGVAVLVVAAIAVGNAAFETGNITGAALGLEGLTGAQARWWALAVGAGGFVLLATGVYKVIERVLIALVVVMSIVFVVTAIIVRPDLGEFARGLFIPTIPAAGIVMVIALIGTTVVPYNLFLHASSVQEKWPADTPTDRALAESRTDTFLSIGIGGIVTLAILSTAAAALFAEGATVEDASDMALSLEPLLGPAAGGFFAAGLFAAGLTSAVTAPLAAAYATAGVLGWGRNLKDWRFRAVWAAIVVIGTFFAVIGQDPIAAIVFAQAANGLLLPIIAVFLLVVLNRSDLLRNRRNGIVGNVLGIAVVLVATGIGLFNILSAFGIVG